MGVSASRNDKNASVPVVPETTWLVSAAVAEGMETGCVASYWASSDMRLAGRVGAYGRVGAETTFAEPTRSSVIRSLGRKTRSRINFEVEDGWRRYALESNATASWGTACFWHSRSPRETRSADELPIGRFQVSGDVIVLLRYDPNLVHTYPVLNSAIGICMEMLQISPTAAFEKNCS